MTVDSGSVGRLKRNIGSAEFERDLGSGAIDAVEGILSRRVLNVRFIERHRTGVLANGPGGDTLLRRFGEEDALVGSGGDELRRIVGGPPQKQGVLLVRTAPCSHGEALAVIDAEADARGKTVSFADFPRRFRKLAGERDGPFDLGCRIADGGGDDGMEPCAVIVDAITVVAVDYGVPYPVVHVEEAQQAAVRRFGLLALIRNQIFEVEKLAVEVGAFDHEGLAERHAAQQPPLGHGGAVERHLAIDFGHGLEVLADSRFGAVCIPGHCLLLRWNKRRVRRRASLPPSSGPGRCRDLRPIGPSGRARSG